MNRFAFGLAVVLGATACAGPATSGVATPSPASGTGKIRHVVVIMQENRSFDEYFGTYPGARGIPMGNGEPSVCVPDPVNNQCVKPYHDPNDVNRGGPHAVKAARDDIGDGSMDGFIADA